MELKQYGLLIMALLLGGGFSFGAMMSYAGMTDSQSSGQQTEFNGTVPSNIYQEQPYPLTAQEQRVVAVRNDIVFVNAFYDNQDQLDSLKSLESLANSFDNRVYVNVVNSSANSDVLYTYGVTEFPKVVVIGGSRGYRVQPFDYSGNEQVAGEICNAFRNLGDQSARCI